MHIIPTRLSKGAIAGVVLGSVGTLLLVLFALSWRWRRRRWAVDGGGDGGLHIRWSELKGTSELVLGQRDLWNILCL